MSERPCIFCGRPVVITHWWQRLYRPSDSCFGRDLADCRDLFIAQTVARIARDGGTDGA